MTTEQQPKIIYPDASELEPTGDWRVTLYLIPAEESESGVPGILASVSVGNGGCPEPAWHDRWKCIGRVPEDAVGESVLAMLGEYESDLLDLAAAYEGSQWDGNNHVGSWADDGVSLDLPWHDVAQWWDPWDWFQGQSWVDVCTLAHIDPERGAACLDELVAALTSDSATGDEYLRAEDVLRHVTNLLDEHNAARR